ncbi:alpha/beta hydrolase family protein [Actinomyces bovis]|nr:alpha/beta hydrolase [Actinomyces bovis]
MPEVRIDTPRGITLAATLELPEGAEPLSPEALEGNAVLVREAGQDAARDLGVVILAHDFLADRHGLAGRLDHVGAAYREAGLATLAFDFSGLGASEDDVITLAGEVEDLRAVSGWLAERGFTRQGVHANGFGATAALLARPELVRTAVAVGMIIGPQSILWEEVFSPEQLDELDQHGLTRVPDDNANGRQWDVLSKETLVDVSMQDPQKVLAEVAWPVLLLHGALANEFPGTAEAAAQGFQLLPQGSRLAQVQADDCEQTLAEVARLGVDWMRQYLG